MRDLHLNLKAEYFNAIKDGTKLFEYRRRTPHWRKIIEGKEFARWVAKARGYDIDADDGVFDDNGYIGHIGGSIQPYAPHEDWLQGGPLLEKHRIDLISQVELGYQAEILTDTGWRITHGETALIAICRAVVMAKFGDTVPDEVAA